MGAKGRTVVVLMHGYDMNPADLTPFAHSIEVPALFLMPRGRVSSPNGNYAWWEMDAASRKSSSRRRTTRFGARKADRLSRCARSTQFIFRHVQTEYEPSR